MEPKILDHDDALSFLEGQINQAIYDYETNLSKQLGHGQKDRLIGAIMRYPALVTDFSAEGEAMVKAYSALKICIDSQVSLGVELVHEGEKLQSQKVSND